MEQNLKQVNNYIHRFKEVLNSQNQLPDAGKLKVGVDLGTANIVIAVLTENNKPIAGSLSQASVIRDGLVVDFVGAVEIVRQLKTKLEGDLGLSITDAATAVLPGTISGNWKVFQNVLESADINVTNILDEPTAAASALGIKDGAVVDIGGGTTGVSILENGDVIYTGDEPTGGTHMTLVLSGYYNISIEKAERLKKDKTKEKDIFPIIQPVVEKMAMITKRHLQGFNVNQIYLVGGASSFGQFASCFEKIIGVPTVQPVHPLLITPLGIAMNG